MKKFEEMAPLPPTPSEEETLLHEWLTWWYKTDEAPAKMPNALHVRTAIFFTQLRLEREK